MRIAVAVVLLGLVGAGACGFGRGPGSVKFGKKAAEENAPKTVPYIVNDKSDAPDVALWGDKERSEQKPRFRVPKGTKCEILGTTKPDPATGKSMIHVKAVTGEEGWVPDFCVEMRRK